MLPENIDWPIAFREIRVRPGSAFAGLTIRGIPLRSATGASVLAVIRTGRIHYEPGPDFQIYPGDRLVIMGHPDELKDAEDLLGQMQKPESDEEIKFAMAEIEISADSKCAGQNLEQMHFRQKYAVTVVGICRAGERIMFPGPHETLQPEDKLIIIGTSTAVDSLKKSEPL